jgi:hypothetical protein
MSPRRLITSKITAATANRRCRFSFLRDDLRRVRRCRAASSRTQPRSVCTLQVFQSHKSSTLSREDRYINIAVGRPTAVCNRAGGVHRSIAICEPSETRASLAPNELPSVTAPLQKTHNSISEPPYLSPRVDPWVFLVIPGTYFRANISDDEGRFVLAYNLMMFAIVAVCLAAIHLRLRRGKEGR